jgi:hypothetical protein
MSEPEVPAGIVSRDDLAALAALFDRYAYAFDPLSLEAREARSQFEDRVLQLYCERVEPNYQSVSLGDFRAKIRSLCREHLRKNAP